MTSGSTTLTDACGTFRVTLREREREKVDRLVTFTTQSTVVADDG